ncbi:MAG: TIGR01777 family oxidoreductase [Flavobacteriaceae bacterium]
MQRILITGATGLVGKEIVKQCHNQNIAVHYLSTSKSKLKDKPNYKGFYWNPSFGEIDVNCFEGVEVIINLAGATIAKRWTNAYKEEILKSRVEALQLLYNTIKTKNITLKHLVSASAIGIYPDSLTQYYDEDFNDFDDRFLAKVVTSWENEADQFKSLNIKVSKIRIGIVLSKQGGALPQLVKPIKWFVGSTLGSGNQWQSWIHIEDLAAIFMYVVNNTFEGIFNGVAPNAVTQREMVKSIAKEVKRPILLPAVPSFVLKFVLGEMSTLVLESQRVSSKKIEDLGFTFKYYQLQPALEDVL